jgi:MoxR-like ATPase
MFKVFVQYPSFSEEFEIAQRTTGTNSSEVEPVLTAQEIIALQKSVREVPLSDHIARYALAIVRQTRVGADGVPDFISDQLAWGAGPRAVQNLILGCKARTLLQGRPHVSIEDVQALAAPVLRHRIVVGFAAESEGVSADSIIEKLIETTPAHEDELTRDPRFQTIFAS